MAPITEDEFLALCQEAKDDARSTDPTTLLHEILVRVRARRGDTDPRSSIQPIYDAPLTEAYRLMIERTVGDDLGADFDVSGTISEFVRKSTEDMERKA